ncbi:MAG: aminoacyl-tRNA hydrolase [Firmicutes bacterium]|nr:aminoacyl-tRNA hydrolase [Bacillota bacterium]
MFCLIGLGNPGAQYLQTRHNAGFLVIDRIADAVNVKLNKTGFHSIYGKGILKNEPLVLVKPQTFMNLSGEAVAAVVNYYRIPLNQVLIIHDEMDLPLGAIRIRLSGSAGGHNGLKSVLAALGSQNVPRLRVGIGRPENETDVDYVLSSFSGRQLVEFMESIDKSAQAAISFVIDGPEHAMNRFNRNPAVVDKEGKEPSLD